VTFPGIGEAVIVKPKRATKLRRRASTHWLLQFPGTPVVYSVHTWQLPPNDKIKGKSITIFTSDYSTGDITIQEKKQLITHLLFCPKSWQLETL
jgi:hypothetical protein